jgi:uncharacterized membrane protein
LLFADRACCVPLSLFALSPTTEKGGRTMSTEVEQYRSPTRKLMRFFQRSRDSWKAKCLEAKLRVKRLHTKVADLRASRERWKQEVRQLRVELAQAREKLEEQKAGPAA